MMTRAPINRAVHIAFLGFPRYNKTTIEEEIFQEE
jgi:hypothetical protein